MDKIEILQVGIAFQFHRQNPFGSYQKLSEDNTKICSICGANLIEKYVHIINKLKENNLLPKKYKMICCFCAILKEKIGKTHCECGSYLTLRPALYVNSVTYIVRCLKCNKKSTLYDAITYAPINE